THSCTRKRQMGCIARYACVSADFTDCRSWAPEQIEPPARAIPTSRGWREPTNTGSLDPEAAEHRERVLRSPGVDSRKRALGHDGAPSGGFALQAGDELVGAVLVVRANQEVARAAH